MNSGCCNNGIVAGAKFCSSCGAALRNDTTNVETETQKLTTGPLFVIAIAGAVVFAWGGSLFHAEPSVQQAQQVSAPIYLSELALICRTAEQIPQFLRDLENNHLPNIDDCAVNPTKEQIRVEVVTSRVIGQDTLVQWRRPSTGFQAWTLESNLVRE